MEERLQKLLSAAGVCSRRTAETYLIAGRVTVNGQTAHLGQRADPDRDEILVDGRPLAPRAEAVYILLNKPRGYVSTLSDERGRRTVAELVADCGSRVYPVGRLDLDSEGLLLLTNDGELAQRLTHPRHHQPKVYEVLVRGPVPETELAAMRQGMRLAEGQDLLPVDVERKTANSGNNTLLRMVLCQGVNRQIRRMCRDLGLTILRLRRVAQGPLDLGELTPGQARQLTAREGAVLRSSAGLPSSA